RPRPRSRINVDKLLTNHGGVAAIAVPGVRLAMLDLGTTEPKTFEFLCVRVTSGTSSCVVIIFYRTGTILEEFFAEMSDLLDRFATLTDPLYIVGDVNIHLDRSYNSSCRQFCDMLALYGMHNRVASPTHDHGRTLDIVASRDDLSAPSIDVLYTGLSDHR